MKGEGMLVGKWPGKRNDLIPQHPVPGSPEATVFVQQPSGPSAVAGWAWG